METEKSVLITGCNGGIGNATCKKFIKNGFFVIGSDTHRKCSIKPDKMFRYIQADISGERDVTKLSHHVENVLSGKKLTALVNCAGITGDGGLQNTTLDAWHKILDVNLTSCFLLSKSFENLIIRDKGVVVFCGSSNAHNGGSELSGPAYSAAKAGVENFVRYLAKEWAEKNIRVNAVSPGPIDTHMLAKHDKKTMQKLASSIILKRLGEAQEVANAIYFLCSEESSWVTGTSLNISGGLVLK